MTNMSRSSSCSRPYRDSSQALSMPAMPRRYPRGLVTSTGLPSAASVDGQEDCQYNSEANADAILQGQERSPKPEVAGSLVRSHQDKNIRNYQIFSGEWVAQPLRDSLSPNANGAGERNRTPDRLITNQLLYLLSYASFLGSVMGHSQNTCVEGRHHGLRAPHRQAFETAIISNPQTPDQGRSPPQGPIQ